MFKLGRKAAAACTAVVASGLAVCTLGLAASSASAATKTMPGLMTPGTLTVGMDLQFKPEMYLQGNKPAGYGFLVKRSIEYEISGRVVLELRPAGVHCLIEFPLRRNVQRVDRG